MHFETKLVIFLVDLKMKELEYAANAVVNYLMDMYADDVQMRKSLTKSDTQEDQADA